MGVLRVLSVESVERNAPARDAPASYVSCCCKKSAEGKTPSFSFVLRDADADSGGKKRSLSSQKT